MGSFSFGLLGRRSAAISVGAFLIRCRTFEASGRHADLPRTAGRRVHKLVLHGLTLSTRVRPAQVGPTNYPQHAPLREALCAPSSELKQLVGILYHTAGQLAESPQLLPIYIYIYICICIRIVIITTLTIIIAVTTYYSSYYYYYYMVIAYI